MKRESPKGYITEKEAAKLLGRSLRWFQNDRYESKHGKPLKLPFIKKDAHVLYKKEDVTSLKGQLSSPVGITGGISTTYAVELDKDSRDAIEWATNIRAELDQLKIDMHFLKNKIEYTRNELNILIFEVRKPKTSWLLRLFR